MPYQGKVEEYNLEDTVLELFKDGEGWSRSKIARHLNSLYPKVKWNVMDISRFLERHKKRAIEEKFNNGKNIIDEFGEELSNKLNGALVEMDNNIKKMNDLYERVENSNNIHDLTNIIKTITQVQEQQRRNLVSIAQYYNTNVRPVAEVTRKQQIKIDTLILNLSKDFHEILCPECMSKLNNRLVKLVDKKDYEVE
jgi:uncharacterized protein (UPF0305 family)